MDLFAFVTISTLPECARTTLWICLKAAPWLAVLDGSEMPSFSRVRSLRGPRPAQVGVFLSTLYYL